jgi:hypothetical protein
MRPAPPNRAKSPLIVIITLSAVIPVKSKPILNELIKIILVKLFKNFYIKKLPFHQHRVLQNKKIRYIN